MIKIGIIIGSTRPGRIGDQVGKWVYEKAQNRKDAEFELIDLQDYHLPILDEPYPASMGKYTKEHTKKWSEKIAQFDGYILVTPEYNQTVPGALKNALDYLSNEWKNKVAGFVSYGSIGGARAVEHLRQIMGGLQVADVKAQVMYSLFTDFKDMSEFTPDPRHDEELEALFDQVIAWSKALKTLR